MITIKAQTWRKISQELAKLKTTLQLKNWQLFTRSTSSMVVVPLPRTLRTFDASDADFQQPARFSCGSTTSKAMSSIVAFQIQIISRQLFWGSTQIGQLWMWPTDGQAMSLLKPAVIIKEWPSPGWSVFDCWIVMKFAHYLPLVCWWLSFSAVNKYRSISAFSKTPDFSWK